MPPRVQIVEPVFKRLEYALTAKTGYLFGTYSGGSTLILGLQFELDSEPDLDIDPSECWFSFTKKANISYPGGIDYFGIIQVGREFSEDKYLPAILKLQYAKATSNPIYIQKNLDTGYYDVSYLRGDSLYETDYEVIPYDVFQEKFVMIRFLGDFPIQLPQTDVISTLKKEVENMSNMISSGMGFHILETDITLFQQNTHKITGLNIKEAYNQLPKKRDYKSGLEVLNVMGLFPLNENNKKGATHSAPYILEFTNDEGSLRLDRTVGVKINFPIDGFCLVSTDYTLNTAYNVLISGVKRALFFIGEFLFKHFNDSTSFKKINIENFFNNTLGHPLTVVFLADDQDTELTEFRRSLHESLNIQSDRPLFRKSNSLKFLPSSLEHGPLLNVHIGLKPPSSKGVSKRNSSYVYGNYEYYHYLTGGFDDTNWGCAYRSCQTIFSWFRLQGYSDSHVPTHNEIQNSLVKIGDKQFDFLGSKTWIGSTEIMYVLESELGISCQIINISSGAELSTLGEQFIQHFDNHGTPVMIGGGVLAHTIIGVSVDEDFGDPRFLVLDPHYTGKDNVSSIQKGGYVGWKPVSFWNTNSYYNLCFPLRPLCI